jgi:hypothetical protein
MWIPQLSSEWWTVAHNPDLGSLTDPDQEPVDFGIWQAADGTWQLWSCIRKTRCRGKTRLFHCWQGSSLTGSDWVPMGIAMQADPRVGETPGGLQAPYVVKVENTYHMFYGDWEHICLATSRDGKTFTRQLNSRGRSDLFSEGQGANTRDPMILPVGDYYCCYYTAYPGRKGAVYCRVSEDLRNWSDSKVVAFGGAAGTGPFSAECPFAVHRQESGHTYLFRTQRYGKDAQTTVYCANDPLDFGTNDDQYLVGTLPVAAPEIVEHEGQQYLACLLPSLSGIRITRLTWLEVSAAATRSRGVA